MLILDSSKRLSIDIDIIMEKGPKNLEGIFKALLEGQGFFLICSGLTSARDVPRPLST